MGVEIKDVYEIEKGNDEKGNEVLKLFKTFDKNGFTFIPVNPSELKDILEKYKRKEISIYGGLIDGRYNPDLEKSEITELLESYKPLNRILQKFIKLLKRYI